MDQPTLDLSIAGLTYRVEPQLDRGYVRLYRLDRTGLSYDVTLATDAGPHSCDCPDYQHRHKGLDFSGCKHVRALTSVGLLPAITATLAR